MGHVKRIWYLWPMRRCAVSPELSLLARTSNESRGTFRQKARSLTPLNGRACAVKICHDGMLKDKNSLDVPHMLGANLGLLLYGELSVMDIIDDSVSKLIKVSFGSFTYKKINIIQTKLGTSNHTLIHLSGNNKQTIFSQNKIPSTSKETLNTLSVFR